MNSMKSFYQKYYLNTLKNENEVLNIRYVTCNRNASTN